MGTKEELNTYESYIHRSRYARYIQDDHRRERWIETATRYCDFFERRTSQNFDGLGIRKAIYNRDVMPSMRALMTAGPALDRDNVAGYNCAYVAVDNVKVFDEIMYVLMCGTGVGFSVERQYVNQLPEVAEEFHDVDTQIKVKDSKIGWASSFRQLVSLLYSGQVPEIDVSRLRPSGSVLRTFGGRASGPEPLQNLCLFTVNLFRKAAGRKLTSLECHDLVCKVAEVVVCGGVRRSALLSLSNLTDDRMREAKSGDFYQYNPQRTLSNNSVAYTEKPDIGIFLKEWTNLYQSKSGERGIFSRYSCVAQVPERREVADFGTNPCSEIVLRSKQFCNLTEVVVRPTDTLEELKGKVRTATILGTMQATLTDFRYLSAAWKKNTEEERLLGVSLTGIYDHKVLGNYEHTHLKGWLTQLKEEAVKTNEEWADKLGIPRSTAITCVKPSGTVSQLCGVSSGIHPRYSPYYIRRVRATVSDPLCTSLIDAGVPYELDKRAGSEYVFSFPIKSPKDAVCTRDVTAIDQLKLWSVYDEYYCEHKPSVTINVREMEWLEVAAYVYKEFDTISGISFFPYDDHIYPQAPYEEITEDQYDALIRDFPKRIDFDVEEDYDNTTASQELACSGPSGCDI